MRNTKKFWKSANGFKGNIMSYQEIFFSLSTDITTVWYLDLKPLCEFWPCEKLNNPSMWKFWQHKMALIHLKASPRNATMTQWLKLVMVLLKYVTLKMSECCVATMQKYIRFIPGWMEFFSTKNLCGLQRRISWKLEEWCVKCTIMKLNFYCESLRWLREYEN